VGGVERAGTAARDPAATGLHAHERAMRIAVNSLRNLTVRSTTVVFILALGVLIARALGPTGRGVIALITLYSSIGVAALGGMGAAAGYHISNLRRPVPEVVANVVALALLVGTAALALTLAGYWLAAWLLGDAPWWLVMVGAAQPAMLVGAALTWVFLGADDQTNYSYAILAPSLFSLVLMLVALVVFPHSLRAAVLAWLLAQYAVVAWVWWCGRRAWTPLPLEAVSLASMGNIVGFSMMTGLANVLSMLNYRVDLLFIDRILGTAQVGVYAVAVQLAEGLLFISQAVGVAIWARVGAATREEAAALTARSIRYALAIMLAAAAVIFLAAGVAVPLLFGERFAGAVTPLRVSLLGVVAWGAANLLAAYYTNQLGRPRVPLAMAAFSLLVAVALCPLLIPLWGLTGGALVTTVSYTTAIVAGLCVFRRDTGIGWRNLLLLSRADLVDAAATTRDLLRAIMPTPPARPVDPIAPPAAGGAPPHHDARAAGTETAARPESDQASAPLFRRVR
jgi:O-antigen/teichoic acid export membrane protein